MVVDMKRSPFVTDVHLVDDAAGIKQIVRSDPWHWVRIVLVGVFGIVYMQWFRDHGIVVDPISVLVSVGLLLVVAHIGKPLYRWRQLVIDLACYSVMWLSYNETYGIAGRLGQPRQVESVRNIDRFLFLGTDPNVWVQQHFYDPLHVRWYDVVASCVYFTHFIVPATVMVLLWVNNRQQWVRWMRRFATVLAIACITFVLMPTVPPWLAGEGGYHALPTLARPVSRGWQHIGLGIFSHAWDAGKDFSNPLAAMPSLHASFALFTVAFFLPAIKWRWLKVAVFAFPVAMAMSLVYLGEHYVADIIAGWLVVGFSFYVWNRIERALRLRRSLAYHRLRLDDGAPAVLGVSVQRRTKPRRVFLDAGFIEAALDVDDFNHAEAVEILDQLVHEYEDGAALLYTHAGVAAAVDMPEADVILAMCDVARLHRDLRRNARRVMANHPGLELDVDQAMALVLMRRGHITEIASFEPLYRALDIATAATPDRPPIEVEVHAAPEVEIEPATAASDTVLGLTRSE